TVLARKRGRITPVKTGIPKEKLLMDLTIIKAMLDRYYTETDSYIEDDNGGSTVLSAGCVLLASVMAGTRSPDVIATLTGLPIEFVTAVWMVSDAGGHIFSLRYADLILAVRMFVVVSGTVRAFQQNTDGREQVIHVDQAGSAIADVVVFDDGPYPASAVAETDAEVLFLRKEDVRQLCLKYPDFSLGALKLMAQRVRKHAQVVNVLSLHEVGQRLAFLLLSEAERAGLQPKGRIDFRLSLSNHEIATRIGTVRDVVSRAFARLQHQQTGSFGQPDRNVRIADNPLGTPKLITRVAETTGST